MPIKWGNTTVTVVKWGNTTCTVVKWGNTEVYPNCNGYNGGIFTAPIASGFTCNSEPFYTYSSATWNNISALNKINTKSNCGTLTYYVFTCFRSKNTNIAYSSYSSIKITLSASITTINSYQIILEDGNSINNKNALYKGFILKSESFGSNNNITKTIDQATYTCDISSWNSSTGTSAYYLFISIKANIYNSGSASAGLTINEISFS